MRRFFPRSGFCCKVTHYSSSTAERSPFSNRRRQGEKVDMLTGSRRERERQRRVESENRYVDGKKIIPLRRRRILFHGFLLLFFAFSCMIEEVITGFATQNGKDGILCSLFRK